jgi:hypothetical protein
MDIELSDCDVCKAINVRLHRVIYDFKNNGSFSYRKNSPFECCFDCMIMFDFQQEEIEKEYDDYVNLILPDSEST